MSDYGHKLTNDELKKLERRIEEVYKQAAEEEKKFIEEYFEKFKLRDAEMKLELDKGNITEQQYIDWRKTQIMRGDGFEAMQKKLSERMTKANEVAISYVNDATPSIYSLNRNYAAYTIEQATDAVDFTLFDERTVKRLIADNPSVMPYYPPKRAVNRGIDLEYGQKKISQIVTSGILRGVSIPTMANELQGQLTSMSRASAIRAARTATTGAQNGGRQDSYNAAVKMGIKLKKEWMATLDDRTRVSHQELDGERVAPDKKFSNGLMFPGDPSGAPAEVYNCRCTMIAVFPETEKELDQRKTYKEWIAQKEKVGKVFTSEKKHNIISNVNTGGHRNEKPLTEKQKAECTEYAVSLGMPEERIRFVDAEYTSYGSVFDILVIGSDVYPNENGSDPNDLLSYKAAIAHEIIGHRQAAKLGIDLHEQNEIFDEAQASIRASRYAPNLTQSERVMLLRDAVSRLHHNGYTVKEARKVITI